MVKGNKKIGLVSVDYQKVLRNLDLLFVQPIVELWFGLSKEKVPLYLCMAASCLLQILFITGIDFYLLRRIDLLWMYPSGFTQIVYRLLLVFSPLWFWGFFQVLLRIKLIKQLSEIFLNSGLKSVTGKLPAFIFDKPIDEYTRRMRVSRNGQSLKAFECAKDDLESGLQVFIDEITENRMSGSIDLIYAHKQLDETYEVKGFADVHKDSFLLGKGRSKSLYGSLSDSPHLLVAGQTGMGKSTFLRQFITSLYLNNKGYSFDLVDLKEGLEFQIFDDLPRVKVLSSVIPSIALLKKLATTTIKERSQLFKANECKDILAFQQIPEGERKGVKAGSKNIKLDRHIVVIDEAFDLFMAGPYADAKAVQASRRFASKIAAQGRAVGVHLIVATQRPDRLAIDPQTKANLTGKVCFRVPNIPSSQTIMDSRRAFDLPNIKGRAIWQNSSEQFEVQTPYFTEDQAITALTPFKRTKKQAAKKEKNYVFKEEPNTNGML